MTLSLTQKKETAKRVFRTNYDAFLNSDRSNEFVRSLEPLSEMLPTDLRQSVKVSFDQSGDRTLHLQIDIADTLKVRMYMYLDVYAIYTCSAHVDIDTAYSVSAYDTLLSAARYAQAVMPVFMSLQSLYQE